MKTACMRENVFLWTYVVSIPEDGVSSQIEFDMGWNCVEVFLRYSGSWNSALARMTTKDSQHFIFTDDHTLSLNDFSLVHSHLLGTGSCSWYRLGIYALCIILNMRKRKRMALDAPQIKKKSNLLDVCIFMQFMLCCYIAISSFYFFSNFQSQSTILD